MPLRNETVYEPIPSLSFVTNPSTFSFLKGRVYWDEIDQTLAIQQSADVSQQIGQEQQVLVWNNTGVDWPNGTILYPNGSLGYRPTGALSKADAITTAIARGMATEPIPKNTEGFVTTFGMVRGFDTQTPGWAEGDFLYLSETDAGKMKNSAPTSGFNIWCAYVLRRHPTQGVVFFVPSPRPSFGDTLGGHYTSIDFEGGIKYIGNAQRHLTLRPHLMGGIDVLKPTFVTYGAYGGYSFPVFAADDEELFFRENIPGRWNGASNISATAVFYLAGAEDAGDKFRFQVSWANKAIDNGVVQGTTTDVNFDQTIIAGRTAQYSIYSVTQDIDWDLPATDVAISDYFGGRIRRIASDAPAVTNEIVLVDFYMTYYVDKVFKK